MHYNCSMSKNPLINALGASAYIFLVGIVMNYLTHMQNHKPDTFFAPVALISLFTLSAALMGYFFIYQPVLLYLDGKKKEATTLFIRTVLIFAGFTGVIFGLFLTGIIH